MTVQPNTSVPRGPRWLLILWLVGLALTAWISLLPGHRIGTIPGSDKAWHALSYLLLASPLGLLFPRRSASLWALLFLTVYGAAIEVAQQFVPARSFEWADMAANTSGAIAGLVCSRWLASKAAPVAAARPRAHPSTAKPRP